MPLNRLKKKTTKEILWVYILRLLKDREIYAYELKDELKKRFSIEPARVTSYVVLYRLEDEGYVASTWDRNKKYYRITKKGEDLLEKGIKHLSDITHKLKI